MAFYMRLLNLPTKAQTTDIRQFFKDFQIPAGGIHIIGGKDDEAHINFATEAELLQALLLDEQSLCGTPVKLLLALVQDKEKISSEQHRASPNDLQTAKRQSETLSDVSHGHNGNRRKLSPACEGLKKGNDDDVTTSSKHEDIRKIEKDRPAKDSEKTSSIEESKKGERGQVHKDQGTDGRDQANESKRSKGKDNWVKQTKSNSPSLSDSDSTSGSESSESSMASQDTRKARTARSGSRERDKQQRDTHKEKIGSSRSPSLSESASTSESESSESESSESSIESHDTHKERTAGSRSREKDKRQWDTHKEKIGSSRSKVCNKNQKNTHKESDRSRSKERDRKRRDAHEKKHDRSRSKERDRKQRDAHKKKHDRSRSKERDRKQRDAHTEKRDRSRSKERDRKQRDAHKESGRSRSREGDRKKSDAYNEKSGSSTSTAKDNNLKDTHRQRSDRSRSKEKDRRQQDSLKEKSGSSISTVTAKREQDTSKERTEKISTEKDKQQPDTSKERSDRKKDKSINEDPKQPGHAIISKLESSVTAADLRDYFRGCRVSDRCIIIKKSDYDTNTLIAGVTFLTMDDAMRAEEMSAPLHGHEIDIRFVSERMFNKTLESKYDNKEQALQGAGKRDTPDPASYWEKYRQHAPPGMWPWYYPPQGPLPPVPSFPPGYPGLPGPPPPGAQYAGPYYPTPNISKNLTPPFTGSVPQLPPALGYVQKTHMQEQIETNNSSTSIVSNISVIHLEGMKKLTAAQGGEKRASLNQADEVIPMLMHQSSRSTEPSSAVKKLKQEFHIQIHNLKDHMCANVLWSILTSLGAPSKVVRLVRGTNGAILYAYATFTERFPVDEITKSTTLSCFDVSQEDMDSDLIQLSPKCTITEACDSEQEHPVTNLQEKLMSPDEKETLTRLTSQTAVVSAVEMKGRQNAVLSATASRDMLISKQDMDVREKNKQVVSAVEMKDRQNTTLNATASPATLMSKQDKDVTGKNKQNKGQVERAESCVRIDYIDSDLSANRLYSKLEYVGARPKYVTLPRDAKRNAGFAFAVYDEIPQDHIKNCMKSFKNASFKLVTREKMNMALANIGHGFRITEACARHNWESTPPNARPKSSESQRSKNDSKSPDKSSRSHARESVKKTKR